MRSRRRKKRRSSRLPVVAVILTAAVAALAVLYTVRQKPMDLAGGEEQSLVGKESSEPEEQKAEQKQKEPVLETMRATEAVQETEPVTDQDPAELPSSYDIRDHRTVTVSDQGDLGTCWAFAALKAVETSMPGSMAVPLSADHMSIHNSFRISQNSGGDYSMAMAYLLAWQGPVPETEDPYGDSTSPD